MGNLLQELIESGLITTVDEVFFKTFFGSLLFSLIYTLSKWILSQILGTATFPEQQVPSFIKPVSMAIAATLVILFIFTPAFVPSLESDTLENINIILSLIMMVILLPLLFFMGAFLDSKSPGDPFSSKLMRTLAELSDGAKILGIVLTCISFIWVIAVDFFLDPGYYAFSQNSPDSRRVLVPFLFVLSIFIYISGAYLEKRR